MLIAEATPYASFFSFHTLSHLWDTILAFLSSDFYYLIFSETYGLLESPILGHDREYASRQKAREIIVPILFISFSQG